jgi:hypothetical protein
MAVLLALALVLGHGVAGASSTWKRFSDPVLGIEFSYPDDRTVAKGCHGSDRCVALIGRPMPDSDYLVAFEVFDGDLETVAVERAVFRKRKDGWIARGRYTEHPVMPLSGPGWRGIKSVVTCGIATREGTHAAAGECLWVVLSTGKRSVVVDTQGIVGLDEQSRRSIESLRFNPRGRPGPRTSSPDPRTGR